MERSGPDSYMMHMNSADSNPFLSALRKIDRLVGRSETRNQIDHRMTLPSYLQQNTPYHLSRAWDNRSDIRNAQPNQLYLHTFDTTSLTIFCVLFPDSDSLVTT